MVFREANSESYRTGQPKDYNHSLYMNKKTEKKRNCQRKIYSIQLDHRDG